MLNRIDYFLFVFVLAAQSLICRALYRRLSGRLAARPASLIVAAYAFLCAAGFLAGYAHMLPFHLPLPLATGLGGAGHLWTYTSSAAYVLHALFRWFARHSETVPFDPARRRALNAAGGMLIAAPFGVIGYGALVQRTDFRVRELDVPLPGLPPELEGLRLLHLSDIHLSVFLSEPELARVIDAANEVRAHVALVTGDLISSRGDPLDACLRQLSRLRCEAGILGCLGNHEGYAHAEDYTTREGARLGMRFLRQRTQALRFGNAVLNVAGVDYQRMSGNRDYLRGAERLIVPGATNLLLSHNPDVFPVAAAKGFDLMLAGHTHGGQVTVEILEQSINPARFLTPYVYGLYREGKASAYVTRGIGTVGIPARVGAPPEISVLRLRKA